MSSTVAGDDRAGGYFSSSLLEKPSFEPPTPLVYEDPDAPEPSPLAPWVYAVMFPAALVIAKVARVLVLPAMIADGIRLWMHEWGHALFAWACGWMAIPLPIGFTPVIPGRNWAILLVWHAFWGLWTWRAWVAEHRVASAIGAGAILIQWVFAFGLSQPTQEQWMLFGGCAGELLLSAAWMAMFHLRFSGKTRFDFWRWVLMFFGASVFAQAFGLWVAARRTGTAIPWGSMWGEQSDGDMDRLCDEFHWTTREISERYFALACVCGLLVFAGFLWRSFERKRELDDEASVDTGSL